MSFMRSNSKFKNTGPLPLMYQELSTASPLYQPSPFWIKMNSVHRSQLTHLGFTNFKRTINMKYFNWGTLGIVRHQLHIIVNELMKGNFSPFLQSQFSNYKNTNQKVKQFNPVSAWIYRVFIASFADHLVTTDRLHCMEKLNEPALGNPFVVTYKGKRFSQDLLNSIHEHYTIINELKSGKKKLHIAELGAGYGRLAFVFLHMLPLTSYCIIDIPPALFLAQKYLSQIFPNKKIFTFRPFTSFYRVRKEFVSSGIQFIMPHQIQLIPKNYFDIFINVSSLHEMSREKISNYFTQADRITAGLFYTKQWRKSRVKDNGFLTQNEYPIPSHWNLLHAQSPHPVQRMFFDALYNTRRKI